MRKWLVFWTVPDGYGFTFDFLKAWGGRCAACWRLILPSQLSLILVALHSQGLLDLVSLRRKAVSFSDALLPWVSERIPFLWSAV